MAKEKGSKAAFDELFMSPEGFVHKFEDIHRRNPDRSFAFVLGAGASVSSSIPAAGALARRWLKQLYVESREYGTGLGFEQWTRENRGCIDHFDPEDPAGAYPYIYARLFARHPEEGYAELEDVISKGVPRYGYSVLSHILASTRHKVVITTNFDNLVADSLAAFDGVTPIVCGHDALAGFAKPNPRRPLVLKVHHDLFLAPKSSPEELRELGERFQDAVVRLFHHYTPIVIGYGGNDVSFMSVLARLDERSVKSGIYWCYRESDGTPHREILDVVARQAGRVVPIPDFDELMAMLAAVVDYVSPVDRLVQTATERARDLARDTEELQRKLQRRVEERSQADRSPAKEDSHAGSKAGLASLKRTRTDQGQPKTWWEWSSLANAQEDPAETQRIYRQGIAALPDSPQLLGNYAVFLNNVLKDTDAAEETYRRTIAADPNYAHALGNFAVFLGSRRKDYDRAEEYYQRAIAADPTHANNLGNYANFLTDRRKDFDRAEEYYQRAIDADPTHANSLGNYALFLADQRKDYARAEEYYQRAIDADPTHAANLGNYALFLADQRKDYDRAEEYYQRAIDADPTNAASLGNYARFLRYQRNDHERAEELYRRAIAAKSPRGSTISSYALFLEEVRHDFDRAGEVHQQAVAASPADPGVQGNYVRFLICRRGANAALPRLKAALKALDSWPPDAASVEVLFYAIAIGDGAQRASALRRLKSLLVRDGVRSPNWDLECVVDATTKRRNPEHEWLKPLAKVIGDEAPPDSLDGWARWRETALDVVDDAAL